jgi:hypothetical protein
MVLQDQWMRGTLMCNNFSCLFAYPLSLLNMVHTNFTIEYLSPPATFQIRGTYKPLPKSPLLRMAPPSPSESPSIFQTSWVKTPNFLWPMKNKYSTMYKYGTHIGSQNDVCKHHEASFPFRKVARATFRATLALNIQSFRRQIGQA